MDITETLTLLAKKNYEGKTVKDQSPTIDNTHAFRGIEYEKILEQNPQTITSIGGTLEESITLITHAVTAGQPIPEINLININPTEQQIFDLGIIGPIDVGRRGINRSISQHQLDLLVERGVRLIPYTSMNDAGLNPSLSREDQLEAFTKLSKRDKEIKDRTAVIGLDFSESDLLKSVKFTQGNVFEVWEEIGSDSIVCSNLLLHLNTEYRNILFRMILDRLPSGGEILTEDPLEIPLPNETQKDHALYELVISTITDFHEWYSKILDSGSVEERAKNEKSPFTILRKK